MIFGHLTVTAAVHREVRQRRPSLPVAAGALLFGAYLPDLLDKPIALVTGLAGRGYGHSMVVQAAVLGLALLVLPRRRTVVATVALGAAVHLLEDWVQPQVLLAPLLGPIPFQPPRGLWETLRRYYTTPSLTLAWEALATAYWIAVGARGFRSRAAAPAPTTDR